MLSAILALLGSGAKVLATWLGLKKTQQDQAAGVAIQAAQDQKESSDVLQAELAAANAASSDDADASLHKGKF